MATLRLFIAAELPEEIKQELARIQQVIRKAEGKVALARDLHLTYIFLGEVEDKKVPDLVKQLEKCKIEAIQTSLDRIGFFPNDKKPNVIWTGLKNKELIVDQRERIAASIGQPKSNFVAHLTLARVKQSTPQLITRSRGIRCKQTPFTLKGFSLIASVLVNGTREYQVIRSYE